MSDMDGMDLDVEYRFQCVWYRCVLDITCLGRHRGGGFVYLSVQPDSNPLLLLIPPQCCPDIPTEVNMHGSMRFRRLSDTDFAPV